MKESKKKLVGIGEKTATEKSKIEKEEKEEKGDRFIFHKKRENKNQSPFSCGNWGVIICVRLSEGLNLDRD